MRANAVKRALAALLLAGAATSVDAADTGRRLALIVGNSSYVRRPLKNPVNDARLVDQALKAVGFQTVVKENATKQDIEEAVAEIFPKIGPGDTILFYYAGHAVQIQGENFLVPVDLDRVRNPIDAKFKMLSMAYLFEYLTRSPAAQRIVILDACRTNPVENAGATGSGLAIPLNAGKDTYIIFSTSPNMVAEDNPDGRNSYFTEALAELLKSPGLTIDDVMTQVNRRVERATEGRQIPWKQSSLTRRFQFLGQTDEGGADDPTLAETRFRDASRHASRNNWEEAAALLDEVLKAKPQGALLERARGLQRYVGAREHGSQAFAKGDYANAGSAFAEAYGLSPYDSEAGIQGAVSYLLAERVEDAVRILGDLRYRGNSAAFRQATAMLGELAPVSEQARNSLKTANPQPPRPASVTPAGDEVAATAARSAAASQELTIASLPEIEERPRAAVAPAAEPAQPTPSMQTPSTAPQAVETAAAGPEPAANTPSAVAAPPGPETVLEIVSLGDNRDLVFQDVPAAEPKLNTSGVARPGAIQVKVATTPAGATLAVEGDSEQTCLSPCVLSLAPGRRVLRAAKRGFREEARIVQVKAGQTEVTVQMLMKAGKVRFEGASSGVPIRLDGRLTPEKTPAVLQLPEGKYQVRMIVQKNVASTEELEVKDGGLHRVALK